MKFITEFRDSNLAESIIKLLRKEAYPDSNLMEFCGGHTVAIFRSGIREVVPKNVKMLSGPGCPVCVTSNSDIDKAGKVVRYPDVILTTFGDMMKVPGSYDSLYDLRAKGYDIRVVYSTIDALKIAEENKNKKIVFFGIGFETTAPTIAASIIEAKRRNINNYFVISVLKLTIPAIKKLLSLGEVKVNGIIGPGHVSTITGANDWKFLPDEYKIPCVLTGFEPLDILLGIKSLLDMIKQNKPELVTEYLRSVKPEGNIIAKEMIEKVFIVDDSDWRGFNVIEKSGLKISKEFEEFDAEKVFDLKTESSIKNCGCKCDEVLRGIISPVECSLFREVCNPENPLGPCMVSSEGACAAYYNYYVE